jgi:Domain of unknown function (DUF4349)
METPRDRNDRLAEDLRALRPAPHPQFAAELDKRVAAGFPRRSRFPRLSLDRLRVVPAKRLLIPAGSLALVLIAVLTVVVISNESENHPESGLLNLAQDPDPAPALEQTAPEAAPSSSAAGANAELKPFGGKVQTNLQHRAVKREAQVVLGAEPADVAEASAKVLETVHAYDGIVLRSSSHQGPEGEAGAHFELQIPSAKLGDALAALSQIGELRSRFETSLDITAPTATVSELLQDSKARIDSLLAQLEAAETESEREAVEAELRQERRHRARLRANLQKLQRHAALSRVMVRIDTDAVENSGGGAWGVDEALHDAGHVLSVAAAVTLIALAILGPIALVALLAWLSRRAWLRRERRRVLS